MRKIIAFFVCYMIICFFIPSIFIRKVENKKALQDNDNIRLLISETNEVVEMSFEDYLKGVLIGEVPATYEMEALKAQAVVARTYTLHKLKNSPSAHNGADMCDDINHCQAYKSREYAFSAWNDDEENDKWAKIENSVKETIGEVVTYNGELINAFFHAHSGGKTEDARYIWGQEAIPYLKSVNGNESYAFEDSKTVPKEEFIKIIKDKYTNYDGKIDSIIIQDHTIGDRVYHVKIGNLTLLGTEIRTMFGLRSANFEIQNDENNIVFKTKGYGHGVGMSQEGANQMALNGNSYKEIIKHYYTNVEIEKY